MGVGEYMLRLRMLVSLVVFVALLIPASGAKGETLLLDSSVVGVVDSYSAIIGDNHYDTARRTYEYFESYGDGWDTNEFTGDGVIVVSGENFPDAIVASGLSGMLGYPVLITGSATLDGHTASTIKDINPSHIVIVGGLYAVSGGVEASLGALMSSVDIVRIAGANRFETAQKAYEYGERIGDGWDKSRAYVMSGMDYPDALSVMPFCAGQTSPIFFTDKSGGLDAFSYDVLGEYSEVFIIGGEAVVSKLTETTLVHNGYPMVTRLGGANRYATNALVIQGLIGGSDGVWLPELPNPAPGEAYMNWQMVCFVSGRDFPDALTVGTLCGRLFYSRVAIVLVAEDGLPVETYRSLKPLWPHRGYFIGGMDVIPQKVRENMMLALSGMGGYSYEVQGR
jgi:putative cell wall-binding protein